MDLGPADLPHRPVVRHDHIGAEVGLRCTVIANLVANADEVAPTILVSPLDGKGAAGTWWVQPTVFDGDTLEATCQFGEGDRGIGERFAVVAVVLPDALRAGRSLGSLPVGKAYSTPMVVRRVQ